MVVGGGMHRVSSSVVTQKISTYVRSLFKLQNIPEKERV